MSARGRRVPWALLLGLVTAALWAPALAAGWFWDDRGNLLTNPWLQGPWGEFFAASLRPHLGHWQPLTWWSLRADDLLLGAAFPAPTRHLLGNVLGHVAAALAVFGLLREALRAVEDGGAWTQATTAEPRDPRGPLSERADAAAALATLAWALHPCRVESVAWITERRDVLATLLIALGLRGWLMARASHDDQRRRRGWALALIALPLSALAKAWVLGLPGALFALELGVLRLPGGWRAALRRSAAWLALSVPVAAIAWWAQHATGAAAGASALTWVERLVGAGWALANYGRLTLTPTHLAPLHPIVPGQTLAPSHVAALVAVTLVALALAGLAWRRPRWRPLAAALIGAVAWLAPVLGVAQSGVQAYAERYLVVAHIPLALALAVALGRSGPPRRARWLAAALWVAALAWQTHSWLGVWGEGAEALWTRTIAVEAESTHAHENRAALRLQRGAVALAAADLAQAAKLQPRSATGWKLEGEVRRARGDRAGALAALSHALAKAPDDAGARCNRGALLAESGQRRAAQVDLDRAVAAGAGPGCRLNRAIFRARSGDTAGAIEDAEAALRRSPAGSAAAKRAAGMLRALRQRHAHPSPKAPPS